MMCNAKDIVFGVGHIQVVYVFMDIFLELPICEERIGPADLNK